MDQGAKKKRKKLSRQKNKNRWVVGQPEPSSPSANKFTYLSLV